MTPQAEQPPRPDQPREPQQRSQPPRDGSARRDDQSQRRGNAQRDRNSRRNERPRREGQAQKDQKARPGTSAPRSYPGNLSPRVAGQPRGKTGTSDLSEDDRIEYRRSTPTRRKGERSELRSTYTRIEYDRPAPTTPIRTNRGIKARSQRGAFSKNWWARRWIEAMEQLVDPMRLQRGRAYARTGQVLTITENPAGIEASVQGSRPQPYKVQIQVTPLTDEQWDKVIDALSEQALFTAQLLAGEMPENIEDAFQSAGVSLFPDQAGDLYTECSCPDWANPCKHVAACHYILGDRFDDDPFLLFRMRGRSQEQILQALRARRAGDATTEEVEVIDTVEEEKSSPLEESIDHFWDPVDSLDTFPLTIQPPTVETPMLKRLGEPSFIEGQPLQEILRPVYNTFTRSALRAAYSEEEPVESNSVDENGNSYSEVIDGSDPDHSPEE
ncbi:MAG TPA: hypothetical protein VF806_09350 [Anaerolineaceae bacterium]